MDISFEDLPEGTICRVDVTASYGRPIYFDSKLYVRGGNGNHEKTGNELTMWIQQRLAAANK